MTLRDVCDVAWVCLSERLERAVLADRTGLLVAQAMGAKREDGGPVELPSVDAALADLEADLCGPWPPRPDRESLRLREALGLAG